ncbi:hypothetical protein LB572_13700 [Mesorhizobium sp. BH1-1-5]|uniref:hypothetical protein n=1 Tax=unclassified Mesorhizobium TaxID=325217 RepID=UPI00112ACB8B|nr:MULTISPECIES: hypothetical protein [unclassified Mesorhizobium]MBZ9988148.1 hypothetical protein [Mesorhizobium sp. BH1-1-5]TPJ74638.1 hypothetical protein FJ471_01400 [Mesorhizobium sp. B2-7-1]
MVDLVSSDTRSDPTVEASSSAVSWGPIIAGALAVSTLTVILMLVGAGLGLSFISPWSGSNPSPTATAVAAGVWLVIVQWLSSGVGGYLAGRLRTKWVSVHTDEVYFRDTAHGFLAWALATLLVAGVFSSALSSIVGAGVQAASTVASGAAMGASAGAAAGNPATDTLGYYVDQLFRPTDSGAAVVAGNQTQNAAVGEVSRILVASAASGQVSAEDKAYLGRVVASRTGLSQADATKRVDTVLAGIEEAKNKAKAAADKARKASATSALIGALSMIIGAFIASVAATIGGRQRDEEEALFLRG